MSLDLTDLLRDPAAAQQIPPEAIPGLLCLLGAIQTALAARLLVPASEMTAGPSTPDEERLLTAGDAAELLGVTPRWLYRHHRHLPFTRRLSRKALRFSEPGLRRWLAQQRRHD